jgi:hypothetical protein
MGKTTAFFPQNKLATNVMMVMWGSEGSTTFGVDLQRYRTKEAKEKIARE